MEITSSLSKKQLTDALAAFCKSKQRHEVLSLIAEAAEQASKQMALVPSKGLLDFSKRIENLAFAEESDELREFLSSIPSPPKEVNDQLPTTVFFPKANKTIYEEITQVDDDDIDTAVYPLVLR